MGQLPWYTPSISGIKIFCGILIDKIKNWGIDEKLCQDKDGGQCNRNTPGQCMEWQDPIYVNSLAFRKAFDNIIREQLWVVVQVS